MNDQKLFAVRISKTADISNKRIANKEHFHTFLPEVT